MLLVVGIVLQIFFRSIIGFQIDCTIKLINENMVASCISEESKLELYEKGINYAELEQNTLKNLVNKTLKDNLPFATINTGFFFYNSYTGKACVVGVNKCNSVQMRIDITYQNEMYERIKRFEIEAA